MFTWNPEREREMDGDERWMREGEMERSREIGWEREEKGERVWNKNFKKSLK